AGQQREHDIGARSQRVDQGAHAWHDGLPSLARLLNFLAQPLVVDCLNRATLVVRQRDPGTTRRLGEEEPVGPARRIDALEGLGHAGHVRERVVERAQARRPAQDQRSVDVEQQQRLHEKVRSLSGGLMRYAKALPLAALLAATPAVISAGAAGQEPSLMTAEATIKGEGITGTVTLREIQNAPMHGEYDTGTRRVEITATVEGLTPGAHGFH